MSERPIAGETYEVECPFVRDTWTEMDADGVAEVPTWRPGVEWKPISPEDYEPVADAFGKVLYTVVSVHELPRPYHPRVYFVREWIDPDGKRFGNKKLRIMGMQAFKRRMAGYRYAGFEAGRDKPRLRIDAAREGES